VRLAVTDRVAAVFVPQGDWIKPGAVVIDVGVNSKPDATDKRGYKLVGDVDFGAAIQARL
jgi:5,10-methylene-tetrahydrofolate dehydrogenase/methenyl tetrahydrofolate cyclohydrolase